MKKLVYNLGVLPYNVLFQVLEQSGIKLKEPVKVDDWVIAQSSHPEIRASEKTIYLRGSTTEADFRVDVEQFDSPEDAESIARIIDAVLKKFGAQEGVECV